MSEKIHCDCPGCDRIIDDDEPRLEVRPRVVRAAVCMSDIGETRHLCMWCVRDRAIEFREMLIRVLDDVDPGPAEDRDTDCHELLRGLQRDVVERWDAAAKRARGHERAGRTIAGERQRGMEAGYWHQVEALRDLIGRNAPLRAARAKLGQTKDAHEIELTRNRAKSKPFNRGVVAALATMADRAEKLGRHGDGGGGKKR